MSPWTRRILLVEDDPFASTLLASVLVEHGFEVSTCADPGAARQEARDFDPDVAILDIHLGGEATGLQVGYALERAHPEIALMYLTRYPAAVLGDRRHREHVRGRVVLDKDEVADSDVLIEAIETALAGRGTEAPELDDSGLGALTPTQLSVLGLVAEGLTNTTIAQRRGTSERAVEKLIEAIYLALGIDSRGERNARVVAALRYAEVMGHQGVTSAGES
jgi:DNA-binding NarL/FixJ family response regulator